LDDHFKPAATEPANRICIAFANSEFKNKQPVQKFKKKISNFK